MSYPIGHHDSVLRSHRWRTAANSAAFVLDQIQPGMEILDAGCGPGTITSDLAALVGPQGSVIGVDSSPQVLAEARAAHDDVANLRFVEGDVTALDFPEESFDLVYAHQVLQHLPDPVAALREMRRVTRVGGVIAVRDADYSAMTWYPEVDGLDAWRDVYRRTAQHHGTEPDAGRRLLSWAHEAGFTSAMPSASVWCYATPEERQWWGGLQAERIISSQVAVNAQAAGIATEAELQRIAEAWRQWATARDGWFAVLHGEVAYRVPAR